MRVVLDTNVFVSGVFFGGPPARILEAWRDGRIQPVLSAEILEEYERVCEILRIDHPGVDLEPLVALLAVHAELVEAPALALPVCSDPDDDKFLACAVAAGARLIVSGDKDLVKHSGWGGILVLQPRRFVDEYLVTHPNNRTGGHCCTVVKSFHGLRVCRAALRVAAGLSPRRLSSVGAASSRELFNRSRQDAAPTKGCRRLLCRSAFQPPGAVPSVGAPSRRDHMPDDHRRNPARTRER